MTPIRGKSVWGIASPGVIAVLVASTFLLVPGSAVAGPTQPPPPRVDFPSIAVYICFACVVLLAAYLIGSDRQCFHEARRCGVALSNHLERLHGDLDRLRTNTSTASQLVHIAEELRGIRADILRAAQTVAPPTAARMKEIDKLVADSKRKYDEARSMVEKQQAFDQALRDLLNRHVH